MRDYPDVRTLALSRYPSPDRIRSAREMGANAFVTMDLDADGFEDIIRRVVRSDRFLVAPDVLKPVDPAPPPRPVRALKGPPAALTTRQSEILYLVVEGLGTKEIAGRLGLSIKTVEAHRSRLKQRLGVHNVTALVREALRLDLVPRRP